VDLHHGGAVLEEVAPFAAAHRLRIDIEHGRRHPLALPRDRDEAQDVVGVGRRRCIGIGGGLAHVVDHAGASSFVSTISAWRKYASEIASESFISSASVEAMRSVTSAVASAVRSAVAAAIAS